MLHSNKENEEFEYRSVTPIFASRFSEEEMPKYRLYKYPVDPEAAYQLIKDDLLDEGNARQNLATFCQTYMEPKAVQLMAECLEKNAIDKSEYPQTSELEKRCVNIIADLWNCCSNNPFIGTSTVGSSEACMLGGLAMKFRWREEAEKCGLDVSAKKPNLVISSGYQVCWEKFCVYWDIELRAVPMDRAHMSLNMDTVMDYVDEYTIGIVGILGLTYTGQFDDMEKLDELVEAYNQKAAIPIPIHVDAASGGMYVPFVYPDLVWDFRLKNVVSINTSGHKYGLVYPGIGWILWKDKAFLPKELVFDVSYLGGNMPTMAINFSRSASQIIGQYYNFIRYGFEGYKKIHERTRDVAVFIREKVSALGIFELYSDGLDMPVICWKLKEDAGKAWDLYDLSDRLRMNGWQVPTYPLPADMQQEIIQRIVLRADHSMEFASLFIRDFCLAVKALDESDIVRHKSVKNETYGFTH